jgi:hypothetical protein
MTYEERELLQSLDNKLLLLGDRVTAVVRGYSHGLYLCGSGGMGKSYSVITKLEQLEADFRLFNTRMSGAGLFKALQAAPTVIHVLEDVERLVLDKDGQGVLRSALWSQGDRPREVTWTTATFGEQRFVFEGGLVLISNVPLQNLAELKALATRISVLELRITTDELAAHMRRIARQGWKRHQHHLDPEKTLEVCDRVIEECRRAECGLDLRLLDNSCLDYLLWRDGLSQCHWHALIANRVRQAASHFQDRDANMTCAERQVLEREIVREILLSTSDPQEQVRLWQERTGKEKSTWYNRRRSVWRSEP